MKLKIIKPYLHGGTTKENCSDFECVDEEGRTHRVNIFVDGGLPENITTDELIGRTIECRSLSPFLEIANDVQLLP